MCGYPCRRKRSRRRRLRTKKSSVYSVPFQISMSPMILPHLHLRRSKSSSSRGRPRPILSTLLWPQVRREWSRRKILLLDTGKVRRAMPSDSAPPTRTPSQEPRSEEHTSELQSRVDLVCRLLLEKKKTNTIQTIESEL